MKTKTNLQWCKVLTVAVALSVAGFSSGCVAVVAAGAGAGAVAYVRGQLETTQTRDFERTVRGTQRAIEQLGFAKVSEKKDALLATFVARNAADKKIEIRLENLGQDLTKIRIRIGIFGDEELSRRILDKIRENS
ncbi:MAG: DUF3568 domain-containing protein [Opitutus sp.]|nr:DUF3568 domain-containing protein [Opitutus sp.]